VARAGDLFGVSLVRIASGDYMRMVRATLPHGLRSV